jgi:hypothetical protein
VERLLPLTPEQYERARQRLLHPAPGSRIEAAREFGVDLTLLITQLRLTPEERFRQMERATIVLEKLRGIARRRS